MDEELAFLRAIIAEPDDDTTRLVFADWLDEHGRHDTAEFIRLQIESAWKDDSDYDSTTAQREGVLHQSHHKAWREFLGVTDERRVSLRIERGLPEVVWFRAGTEDDYRMISRLPWLRRLSFIEGGMSADVLRLVTALPQLDLLEFSRVPFEPAWLQLLETLPPWTVIRIGDRDAELDRAWQAFQARRVANLDRATPRRLHQTAMQLHQEARNCGYNPGRHREHPVFTNAIRRLTADEFTLALLSRVPQLEELSFDDGTATAEGLRHLTRLPNLRAVELFRTEVETITPLATRTELQRLFVTSDQFGVDEVNLTDDGTEGLERLTELRELKLHGRPGALRDRTVQRLASLKQLRLLEIQLGELGDTSLAPLAGLKKLESLTIDGQTRTEEIAHLAGLTNLKYLSLPGSRATDAAFQYMTRLRKLKTLYLRGGQPPFTVPAARELAAVLPEVTIILDHDVVKSHRDTITFRRRIVHGFASALIPVEWPDDPDRKEEAWNSLHVDEDGWEGVTDIRCDDPCAPASLSLFVWNWDSGRSAAESVQEFLNSDRVEERREVLGLSVVELPGTDSASCVYRHEGTQSICCVIQERGWRVSLSCHLRTTRFEELQALFLFVARSLRVGEEATVGVGEEVTVATTEL